ncbi:energy coupling factor transporter S component ThiW [Halolactibacillus alkaliphilus]|uniref:Energy coupling factor transporter S component ThiW n=1 Tax=Halolactibacillus alkaliphilus TaxID=442899 RepID=A0A511X3M9_9BACI|nr:energy coupling factor transporter S component ThiW [Halolactibacillus alkaliphilus]GEN57541.1 energy coupling factor transporter S component ThiW [Halolactibacillus alkaliphilus]GGN73413.1 energy coupling factor transporter S component ThiW [Halolactibacillus alkaliphilus]SFO95944.1 energy coupling factor transporter S component ThiW [Halolactibacillus alkaliphilus]
MTKTRTLTETAIFIAIGVIGSTFLAIGIGPYRAFFIQHTLNVLLSAFYGTKQAVTVSFTVGLLRNLLGIGTIFAFPGGMFGAYFSGLFYRLHPSIYTAIFGEVIGTGFFGAVTARYLSMWLTGESLPLFFFIPGFFVSSLTGALIALLLYTKKGALLSMIFMRTPGQKKTS